MTNFVAPIMPCEAVEGDAYLVGGLFAPDEGAGRARCGFY